VLALGPNGTRRFAAYTQRRSRGQERARAGSESLVRSRVAAAAAHCLRLRSGVQAGSGVASAEARTPLRVG
jgi:hypothetical protein